MSSFNCLVIHREGQDIAELMAPYSEELVLKPHTRETKQSCDTKYLQAQDERQKKCGRFVAKKQDKSDSNFFFT